MLTLLLNWPYFLGCAVLQERVDFDELEFIDTLAEADRSKLPLFSNAGFSRLK